MNCPYNTRYRPGREEFHKSQVVQPLQLPADFVVDVGVLRVKALNQVEPAYILSVL